LPARNATGVGFIILNDMGENFIILDMGANELMDAASVDAGESRIADSDVVMTVLEVPIAAAARAMELGRRHGVKTILNPAPARRLPDAIFASVDYLTPNESELRILLGLPADDPSSSRELAGELRRRGVRNLVVTLGRSGALILTDRLDVMAPAVPVEVTDTTGAGDAFNSGFAVALAEGRDIVDAVRFGVACGGLACGGLACTRLGVIPGLPDRARADAVYAEAMNNVWRDKT
jgi:ribokinase